MNTLLFVLFLTTVLCSATATSDYCKAGLCGTGQKHIACGNSGAFASTCPADAEFVNITDDLKALLLTAHNERRNFVAGGQAANHDPACRMATAQWDTELAYLAGLNVRQCAMSHDQCRNTDNYKFAGQNLAWIGYFNPVNHASNLKRAVDMWYEEVQNSNRAYIKSYPNNYQGPTIGHFTALVNDQQIRIGCAAATYSVPGQQYKAYLIACDYSNTNIIGFPVYDACTTPAKNCLTGKNPSYPNLCSVNEPIDPNYLNWGK